MRLDRTRCSRAPGFRDSRRHGSPGDHHWLEQRLRHVRAGPPRRVRGQTPRASFTPEDRANGRVTYEMETALKNGRALRMNAGTSNRVRSGSGPPAR